MGKMVNSHKNDFPQCDISNCSLFGCVAFTYANVSSIISHLIWVRLIEMVFLVNTGIFTHPAGMFNQRVPSRQVLSTSLSHFRAESSLPSTCDSRFNLNMSCACERQLTAYSMGMFALPFGWGWESKRRWNNETNHINWILIIAWIFNALERNIARHIEAN